LCVSVPLLLFAVHNFVRYILMTKRYKIMPLFFFYSLTILSLLARSIQFCLQFNHFYCYRDVINVAQTATISRLGAGICHALILSKLYFDIKACMQQESTNHKRRIATLSFIIVFIGSLTVQSVISYSKDFKVKTEFGLQAGFYFLTLIIILVTTTLLVSTIRQMFERSNDGLENEIN
jgi:hypothetical protein